MFAGAGKQAGITVWRIESFEPKPYPKDQYGKFYAGDCYIVLNSAPKSKGSAALNHEAYFWLGADSTQDEYGAAAALTVTLDNDMLGGTAVQSREVQGRESSAFLALFPGAQFLKGGVASGFHKVDRDAFETRLFRLKGRRHVTMTQCALATASLNSGDVFILESKGAVYQWNGSKANKKERAKAVDVCTQLRDDNQGGKATVVVMEEGAETPEFWTALGGKGPIGAARDDDAAAERTSAPKVYKCSDSTGSLKVTEVPTGSGLPPKSVLDTSDVFIVDTTTELYVWVGKATSAEEKRSAMSIADKFLSQGGRPAWARAVKVVEGAEPPSFKAKFSDFFDAPKVLTFGSQPQRGSVASQPQAIPSADIAAGMLAQLSPFGSKRDKHLADDGGGQVKVWRINNFEKEVVPEAELGQFYEGDSYIVQHTYTQRGREMCILYFWQGRESSADEKGASALLTVDLDDKMGGAATQVRLDQGHETEHFLRIFKGGLVVRFGGHVSGFRTKTAGEESEADGIQLYQVKGYGGDSTYGVQVEARAASLNSGDCFVCVTPTSAYVWRGGGSNEDEKAVAAKLGRLLGGGREPVALDEGAESASFWEALGGQGEYARVKAPIDGEGPPRLFDCSNRTGRFDAEEIFGFSQDDLLASEVYLVDTHSTVFVWIGSEANAEEKAGAIELAQAYVQMAGRPKCPITTVQQGSEPAMFTANFLGWDFDKAAPFVDPYEAKLKKLDQENAKLQEVPAWASATSPSQTKAAQKKPPAASESPVKGHATPSSTGGVMSWVPALKPSPNKPADITDKPLTSRTGSYAEPGSMTATLDQLKSNVIPNVDPSKKELYLSDTDFKAAMGCTKAEFGAMKQWRQIELKKKAGLF